MEYLKKSFAVYANYTKTSCFSCGRESKIYVISQQGHQCWECYQQEKERRKKDKLEEEIRRGKAGV